MSHNVRHLVVSAVIHALHGVENASLHGFESVLDVGDGTLQDYIRSIVEEPVLVHSAEVMHSGGVESVHRLIVGVLFLRSGVLLFEFVFVFYFVAHV